MKVFISADIEGCCGVFSNIETHKNEAVYAPFAKQMTKEVLAVCEAAHEAGADEIVVKDGHGDASNIDPLQMPSYVTLIRGKSGHPYNMMFGLDPTFDAVLYVGYHAAAGCPEFAVSHTSTGNSLYITLNGKRMSEFMLNSFTAASLGVPVAFISGDEAICAAAKELVPEIAAVQTKRGVGNATFCCPPETVMEALREQTKEALGKIGPSANLLRRYWINFWKIPQILPLTHDIRMNCFPSSFSEYLVFKNLIPVPKTLLGSY